MQQRSNKRLQSNRHLIINKDQGQQLQELQIKLADGGIHIQETKRLHFQRWHAHRAVAHKTNLQTFGTDSNHFCNEKMKSWSKKRQKETWLLTTHLSHRSILRVRFWSPCKAIWLIWALIVAGVTTTSNRKITRTIVQEQVRANLMLKKQLLHLK